MSDTETVRAWVGRYVSAWESNEPEEISALFTDDAEYYPEPFRQPWRGHREIVENWLARMDEPGDASFAGQPLSITDEVAVIQGKTVYADRTYSNLWVIRLDASGRAREFTEWYMDHTLNSAPEPALPAANTERDESAAASA